MKEIKANGRVVFSRLISKLFSYFLLFLCVILAISLVNNVRKVKNVEKTISDKEKEVEVARIEESELQKKLEYAQSQEFIEKQMRDQLGLAKEGEVVIVMPPPEVVRKFAPKREEKVVLLPDPNWKKWLKLFI